MRSDLVVDSGVNGPPLDGVTLTGGDGSGADVICVAHLAALGALLHKQLTGRADR
ncbi:hypothetical protein [Micromonospora sp. SL4-19]|uniref:hypothetical protein n=1 Tax=Micromonospora sp. SL4-19 TaxID=3399129 RepID=UPI003A4E546C